MIEIKYGKSAAGIDNFFDFLNVQEYIPMSLSELRADGAVLKFYLALFKKFPCKYNGFEFELVYDNEWDIESFCVKQEYVKDRETIAEAIKALIETEGMNVVIDHNVSDVIK